MGNLPPSSDWKVPWDSDKAVPGVLTIKQHGAAASASSVAAGKGDRSSSVASGKGKVEFVKGKGDAAKGKGDAGKGKGDAGKGTVDAAKGKGKGDAAKGVKPAAAAAPAAKPGPLEALVKKAT